jgi:hypothetical protein
VKIQRFERNSHSHAAVHCPYCGERVVPHYNSEADLNGYEPTPCEHTLFAGHDMAFDFVHPVVVEQLKAKGYKIEEDRVVSNDNSDDSLSIDEATDLLEFHDAVKVASYEGPPSLYGSYVGFAPIGQD